MALLNIIEWSNSAPDEILHKVDTHKHIVKRGSALTVREGQTAVFCDKGQVADVFLPGYYKLETDTLPVLTSLLSWEYAFESPFKSDIYFVNTRQFVNCKWGTATPVILRDKEYGAVRVRGYGTYSFRVSDALVFLTELSGARSSFRTEDVADYIRSILVMGVSDALGESGIPVTDMASNLIGLSATVQNLLSARFTALGLELTAFNFESFSLPEEVQKALDENVRLGVLRKNADVYTQIAQADALKEMAKNPGAAGSMLGAGVGLGMGTNLGRTAGETMSTHPTKNTRACTKCGKPLNAGAKFCPECGTPVHFYCPECGTTLAAGSKFCPECGKKLI